MKSLNVFITGATLLSACSYKLKQDRPNILWIILDDTGCDFSCYGNNIIKTPVIDSLAKSGILFTNMHVTAPVSSAARSALITGMYQTSNGTHQHRSSRGNEKIFLEKNQVTVPQYFKNAGYYTSNTGYDYNAKTDYNFIWNPAIYDTLFRIDEDKWVSPWSFRKEGQSFFIQIQLQGGKNRNVNKRYPVDPAICKPAPYYPDDSLFYYDEASYHSSTLHVDKLVGDIMKHLKDDGLDKNTVVMILGDNGQDNYRDKQYLYDGGTRVPFFVVGPEKYIGQQRTRKDLAVHIDMCVASLAMAGIKIPENFEGIDLFAKNYKERDYIITARDRCDWTKDRIRAVRSKDFKYIKNFHPEYPYMQSQYRDEWPMVVKAKKMFAEGRLNSAQAAFFQPTRPAEEFYILKNDIFEIKNEINNSEYKSEIEKFRKTLNEWIAKTDDKGQYPESHKSYEEACRNVNTNDNKGFPVITGTSPLIFSKDSAYGTLFVKNSSNVALKTDYQVTGSNVFKGLFKKAVIDLQPGEQKELKLTSTYPRFNVKDSLVINLSTEYFFSKNSGYNYRNSIVLHPIKKNIVPEAVINIDGKMGDWIRLPYYSFGKAGKAQFGVARSKDFIFIGIQVFDQNVIAFKNDFPWNQDAVEVRFCALKDPERSMNPGDDFIDHLLFAMSPSENGAPDAFYLPALAIRSLSENFFKEKLKYKCKKNPLGYATEIAIPIQYLNNLQNGDWKAFRLNIIVHNPNGIEVKRYSWQPEWKKSDNILGSGTFYRL